MTERISDLHIAREDALPTPQALRAELPRPGVRPERDRRLHRWDNTVDVVAQLGAAVRARRRLS